MITNIRTATIQQGFRAAPAFEWAVKIAMLLNDKYGANIQVNSNIGGKIAQIHWFATYDSLAHLEEMGQKFEADADYQALVDEVYEKDMFVSDSFTDHLFASVP